MYSAIEFVKNEIIQYFVDNRSNVGHVLNEIVLHHKRVNWNPKQQDAWQTALDGLVSEGLIEKKENGYFLTKKGVEEIYPEASSFVRDWIMSYFRDNNARVGDILSERVLQHRMVDWNPKQKSALAPCLQQLASEELIEPKNGEIALAKKGFDFIY